MFWNKISWGFDQGLDYQAECWIGIGDYLFRFGALGSNQYDDPTYGVVVEHTGTVARREP